MSFFSNFQKNNSTDNINMYVDFAKQHIIDSFQYHQSPSQQGAGLKNDCPMNMSDCKPSCAPMFYCPQQHCNQNKVHSAGGKCIDVNF